jgi:hypothetical protein
VQSHVLPSSRLTGQHSTLFHILEAVTRFAL